MLALLPIALLFAPVSPVSPVGETVPELEGLAERWAHAAREFDVPGFAVVVVKNGEIILNTTWGERDTERELPVTKDTMFYIASATKPFVALALLKLEAEGKVDLDRPIKSYLPRFELADEVASDTLDTRDLLCHRAGLTSSPIVFLDAYTGEITEDRFYHFLEGVRPMPDITYSNLHFTLAGRVIQAVTGLEWREYLQEAIFDPLDMQHTSGYADWMYAQEDVAIPTVFETGEFRPAPVRKNDSTMHAAGGLGISSSDAGRWLALNLERGTLDGHEVLPFENAAALSEPEALFDQPNGWLRRLEGFALGWQIGTYRGQRYLQHGGGYVGSSSHFSMLPEEGIGVAVLVNTDAGGQGFCQVASIDVLDRLLGDESGYDPLPGFLEQIVAYRARSAAESESAPVEAAAKTEVFELPLDDYVGTYTNKHWGTVRLESDGAVLAGTIGRLGVRLEPRGGHAAALFTAGDDDANAAAFVIENARVVALSATVDESADPVRFERSGAISR